MLASQLVLDRTYQDLLLWSSSSLVSFKFIFCITSHSLLSPDYILHTKPTMKDLPGVYIGLIIVNKFHILLPLFSLISSPEYAKN